MDRRRFPKQARVPDAGWARGRRGTQDAQFYSLAAFVSKTTSPFSNSTVIRLWSAIAPAMSTAVLLSRRCFACPLLDREVADPARHWQQHAGRGQPGVAGQPARPLPATAQQAFFGIADGQEGDIVGHRARTWPEVPAIADVPPMRVLFIVCSALLETVVSLLL